MGELRNATLCFSTRILVGNHEGKGQLGRTRFRWGDNVKRDLEKNSACDSILLDEDVAQWQTHVNTVVDPRVL
jgi:hypothetical protein